MKCPLDCTCGKHARVKHVEKTCLTCSKKFRVYPSCAKQKYCSRACRTYIEPCSPNCTCEKHPRGIHLIELSCLTCSTRFLSRPSENRKYCSQACVVPNITEAFLNKAGEQSKNWKGGRRETDRGIAIYVGDGQYIHEYRIIAGKRLGRVLTAEEHVHHIDGDPTNNNPENLQVLSRSEHAKLHADQRARKLCSTNFLT